jgi:hypothetical protein
MLAKYKSSLPTSLADLIRDMLESMLDETSSGRNIESFLDHKYWTESLDGHDAKESSLNFSELVAGKELDLFDDMRKAAYLSLPPHLISWLASRTVPCSYVA